MKVKDLLIKLENSAIKVNFYEDKPMKLISSSDIDIIKRIYHDQNSVGEIYNRSVERWVIEGKGESISIVLNKKYLILKG